MGNEVLDFANQIGATDLKTVFDYSEFHGLFKRRNYFLIDKNKFLIIKISRSNRPFWGFGKKFFDLFNTLTEKRGNYFFVALLSEKSGWVLSKREILNQISDGSLSYSENQEQYKINPYNLKDHNGFTSIGSFLKKIGISK
ncbi:hypothetical protein BuS5_02928 [Desulfosarcina sp. BuS5]|uniref:hypothetical protein n=1 Tax=Desulfosarcina sp. BuS5 TaxID=933262 RepID=UPI00237811E1|nr:hypothetical protein [Desulfosarcina sp. BuS5]WDN89958.1 hypothetical protein BuS5_02928 [Desulfosarcina sp. BuS5]